MDENWQIFASVAQMVAAMVAARLLFDWDEKRMTDEQRARAWLPASRGMVICSPLWFFPLWLVGVPLHFLRTRRNLRGVLEAVAWMVASFTLLMVIGLAFELASAL